METLKIAEQLKAILNKQAYDLTIIGLDKSLYLNFDHDASPIFLASTTSALIDIPNILFCNPIPPAWTSNGYPVHTLWAQVYNALFYSHTCEELGFIGGNFISKSKNAAKGGMTLCWKWNHNHYEEVLNPNYEYCLAYIPDFEG